MNKIVIEYINLTQNRNINVLNCLEKLTNGLDDNIIDTSLFDLEINKQFRCSFKNGICIYFNVFKNNNNDIIQAFVSLKKDSYVFISEEFLNNMLDTDITLLDCSEYSIKEINGKIKNDNNTYMINQNKDSLMVEYYSSKTLDTLNRTGVLPFPDKITSVDISDYNIFDLANRIILDNTGLKNGYTKKRINKHS